MCLICQQMIKEPLKCPLNAKGDRDLSISYSSFLTNVSAFRTLGILPVVLKFSNDITTEELVQNQAAWHKSCYVKFSSEKLKRASQMQAKEDSVGSSISGVKSYQCRSIDKMACLFCQQDDGHLHEFRTLEADQNIRQMAVDLEDTQLIVRMEGGDVIALEAKCYLQCLTALRNRCRSLVQQNQQLCGENFEKKLKQEH